MRNFALSLAAVVAMLVVARKASAASVLIQVTPHNIDKQPFTFTIKVKDGKEGKEFEGTVKPKAGKLPPARFFVAGFNILPEDPKIATPTVKRVDREGEEVVFSFQIPQKDVEKVRFSLSKSVYFERKDQKGKSEFFVAASADIYVFDLRAFATSSKK